MQPNGAAAFNVSGDAYDRFMGRYSRPLAVEFATFADIDEAALRVLDVGCGPGALTAELVRLVGASSVVACDPSPSFVPGVRPAVYYRRDGDSGSCEAQRRDRTFQPGESNKRCTQGLPRSTSG